MCVKLMYTNRSILHAPTSTYIYLNMCIQIRSTVDPSVCVCSMWMWVPCVALPSGGGSPAGSSPLCGGSPVDGGSLLSCSRFAWHLFLVLPLTRAHALAVLQLVKGNWRHAPKKWTRKPFLHMRRIDHRYINLYMHIHLDAYISYMYTATN